MIIPQEWGKHLNNKRGLQNIKSASRYLRTFKQRERERKERGRERDTYKQRAVEGISINCRARGRAVICKVHNSSNASSNPWWL